MNDSQTINRRSFLSHATFALALPIVGFSAVEFASCSNESSLASVSPGSWKAQIASAEEPGERLVVSGTIFNPDGKTPLPRIILSVYQTDATGRYSTSGGDNRNTRIHGSMRTNEEGRYRISHNQTSVVSRQQNPRTYSRLRLRCGLSRVLDR